MPRNLSKIAAWIDKQANLFLIKTEIGETKLTTFLKVINSYLQWPNQGLIEFKCI
jgi:hypothetical protein